MSERAWNQPVNLMPISMPRVHLLLIPLPVATLLAVLATDVAYWVNRDPLWAQVSFWLVAAGLVTGPTAGAVGLIDFITIERARSVLAGWMHIMGMGSVLLITLVSFVLRSANPEGAILPWGLLLSALTTVLLAIGAWLGVILAYRRALLSNAGAAD